jgi:CheY-like chemotaxis protein
MRVKLRRPESRRCPRTKVNWPVVVELGDRVLHGETIDLGQFGVKVRLGERLEDASLVTLRLNLPQGCPVDTQAIVWRTDDDGPVFLFLKKAPSVVLAGNDKQSPVSHVLTILVVDDDSAVGSLARDILGSAGYFVLLADDPVEAMRLARHRPGDIDLLLVDVVMPLMDGRELARRVLDLRPKIKVLLMSGFAISGLRDTGWPVIAKPFGVTELIEKIEECMTGKKRSSVFAAPSRAAGRPTGGTTRTGTPRMDTD